MPVAPHMGQHIERCILFGYLGNGYLILARAERTNLGFYFFGSKRGVDFFFQTLKGGLVFFMPHWQTVLINVIKRLFS